MQARVIDGAPLGRMRPYDGSPADECIRLPYNINFSRVMYPGCRKLHLPLRVRALQPSGCTGTEGGHWCPRSPLTVIYIHVITGSKAVRFAEQSGALGAVGQTCADASQSQTQQGT